MKIELVKTCLNATILDKWWAEEGHIGVEISYLSCFAGAKSRFCGRKILTQGFYAI